MLVKVLYSILSLLGHTGMLAVRCRPYYLVMGQYCQNGQLVGNERWVIANSVHAMVRYGTSTAQAVHITSWAGEGGIKWWRRLSGFAGCCRCLRWVSLPAVGHTINYQ